jgi:hypothetical protein
MSVTADDLADYIGTAGPADAGHIAEDLASAVALVATLGATSAPEVLLDRAVLETGAELFGRRGTRNGFANFATIEGGSTPRLRQDVLIPARSVLAPFAPVGIA